MPSAVVPVWFCRSTFHISKMKGGREFKSCKTSEECKAKKEKEVGLGYDNREKRRYRKKTWDFLWRPRDGWRGKNMWDYRKKTDGQSEGFSSTNWKQRLFGRYKEKVEANEMFCAEWWAADMWTRSHQEEKGWKRSPAGSHASDQEVISFPRPPIISRDFLFPTCRSVAPFISLIKGNRGLENVLSFQKNPFASVRGLGMKSKPSEKSHLSSNVLEVFNYKGCSTNAFIHKPKTLNQAHVGEKTTAC